jgi:ribonuclease HI
MAWAYLATNGAWGLGTSIVPGSVVGDQRALQAELRAIANALHTLGADHPITLLCDSQQALGFLTLWRDGHDVMPGGYNVERSGGRESTLAKLARRVRDSDGRIEWDWVRGHAGHPLNEGADALAKMSRAWAEQRLDRETVTAGAPSVVRGALLRHALVCPA